MYQNPRRLRRPEERVGNVTNADLPPPAPHDNESSLVARLRARDPSLFNQLTESWHASMRSVALNFVRSPEDAEEVIQETWLAALSGLDRFECRSAFKTWLFRILVNRARSRGKREHRVIPFSALALSGSDVDQNSAGGQDTVASWTDVPSGAPDPEQTVLATELRDLLESAVNSLPRVQRLVISLRDIEGWSAEEVCGALQITPVNQRVLLHRARMRVRELLAPYF
jgi:RNA polymerase sigma-70 factor (ECF subfamily)